MKTWYTSFMNFLSSGIINVVLGKRRKVCTETAREKNDNTKSILIKANPSAFQGYRGWPTTAAFRRFTAGDTRIRN